MDRSRIRVVNRMPDFLTATQARAHRVVLSSLNPVAAEAAGMTPRENSNLINSQYRNVQQQGSRVVGRIGYTAEYAAAVHEAEGKLLGTDTPRASGKGVVWGPSGEPEFLRKGGEQAKPIVEQALRRGLSL